MKISIIIPTLNEEKNIYSLLTNLQSMRRRGHEIIVTDGGSADNTISIAKSLCDLVVSSERGRAVQMKTATNHAAGDILWFLHADSGIGEDADQSIIDVLSEPSVLWGRFDVSISGNHFLLGIVSRMMNLRSRMTGICTGDQGLFVRTCIYHHVGGFSEIPLMEDIELSSRLKKQGKPVSLNKKIITSGRRWESNGVIRTIFLMWRLRLMYTIGARPAFLAQMYK